MAKPRRIKVYRVDQEVDGVTGLTTAPNIVLDERFVLEVEALPVEETRQRVRTLLETRGLHVRSISFALTGEVVACVSSSPPPSLAKQPGWVFKSPPKPVRG